MRQLTMRLCILLLIVNALFCTTPPTVAQDKANYTQIRTVNATTPAFSFDIYADSEILFRDMEYGEFNDYLPIPARLYTLNIRISGDDPVSPPLYQKGVELLPNHSVTVVVHGSENAPQISLLEDDRSPIRLGKTRVTAFHTVQGAPPMDITPRSGPALVHLMQYGRPYGTVDLDIGRYALRAVDSQAPRRTYLNIGMIGFDTNTLYTLIITGAWSDTRPDLDVIILSAPTAFSESFGIRVRFIHAAPDSAQHEVGPVDIYVDDTLSFLDQSFGTATAYIPLAVYSHEFKIVPAGEEIVYDQRNQPANLLGGTVLSLDEIMPSQAADVSQDDIIFYSFVLTVNEEGQLETTFYRDNMGAVQSDQARIEVLYVVPNALPLDLYREPDPPPVPEDVIPTPTPTLSPGELPPRITILQNIRYGELQSTEVLPGIFDLHFSLTTAPDVLVSTLENSIIRPARIYQIVILSAPGEQYALEPLLFEYSPVGTRASVQVVGTVTGVDEDTVLLVRRGPGSAYDRLGEMENGDRVTVIGRDPSGQWARILFPTSNDPNRMGWAFSEYLALTINGEPSEIDGLPVVGAAERAASIEGVVNVDPEVPLLVRTGPGSSFEEIGRLTSQESVPVVGRSIDGNWIAITYQPVNQPSQRAWVFAEFLTIYRDNEPYNAEELPVIVP